MENNIDKKDKKNPLPEEEIREELDSMYERITDIEKEEVPEEGVLETEPLLAPETEEAPETESFPAAEIEEISDIPPFPIPETFEPPPEKEKKKSYRALLLTLLMVLLASIATVIYFKPIIPFLPLPLNDTSLAVKVPPPATVKKRIVKPSVPPAKPEAMQSTQEKTEEVKPVSPETPGPDFVLPPDKFFAIQLGAFRNMEKARELLTQLKQEGLDPYWAERKSVKKGTWFKVFVGRFEDKEEAAQFIRDKKILKIHPGGFIEEVISSEVKSE